MIRSKRYLLLASSFLAFLFVQKGHSQDNAINTGDMYITTGTIVSDEGSFTISGTGSTENNGDFYLKGDWIKDGSYPTATGKVTFWGTTPQNISGTSGTAFYNAVVNKPSNGVTVNIDADVLNVLTLTNGPVDLNSNKITIKNSAPGGIAYTNGYLISEQTDNSSILQWNMGSTTGAHVIPFGKVSGALIPLTLNLTSGAPGNVTTSTYPSAPDNTPYPVTPYPVLNMNNAAGVDNSANVVDRFWQIDEDDGADGNMTITFTYANGEEPANGEGGLVSQRYYSTYWEAPVPFQSANTAANTVTTPGVTVFGPYTLSQSANPLPVELLSFMATLNSRKKVDINWITASETNNDFFTIQRSKDLIKIESIGMVMGKKSTTSENEYKSIDNDPYYDVSYYRIKQTDLNGKASYSKWNTIINNMDGSFYLNHTYFNPNTDELTVVFTIPGNGNVALNLYSALGDVVFSKVVSGIRGANTFTLPVNRKIANGMYSLNAIYKDEMKAVKLILYY